MTKFYIFDFENGARKYGEFNSYREALNYAESFGYEFTISVYNSVEDYDNSL